VAVGRVVAGVVYLGISGYFGLKKRHFDESGVGGGLSGLSGGGGNSIFVVWQKIV